MKKAYKRLLAIVLATGLLLSGFLATPQTTSKAATITLNKRTVTLKVGKSVKLKLENTKRKFKWTTSSKKVATVTKKGLVKAKKKGKATITAKSGDIRFRCIVTVVKTIATKTTSTPSNIATPTAKPTETPTAAPTAKPTETPTAAPTSTATVKPSETPLSNITYSENVTQAMCSADYWANLQDTPDKVLLSESDINQLNKNTIAATGTNMYDLSNMSMTVGSQIRTSLANAELPAKTLYRNGVKLSDDDKTAFAKEMSDNILSGPALSVAKYGLCVSRADMKSFPTSDYIGYSATDTDEEFTLTSMNVNEPFIIKAITADGKFYYGVTNNCPGWVETDKVAICDNKDEWLASWQPSSPLVVTTDRITLEQSTLAPETSGVKLMLGTILPLVPSNEIPANISERATWYNHVVYVPTRDDNGNYVRKCALIAMHNKVHAGYVPMTQRNILKLAFECLGNRYGWGGMLESMDCSLYLRNIYRCCGLEMPRNTNWQLKMPVTHFSMTASTTTSDECTEKCKTFDTLPAGAGLFFSGHTMMYLGKVDSQYYCISDVGSFIEASDTTNTVKSIYTVAINSLNVRRKSGYTWLQAMSSAYLPWGYIPAS